VQGVVIRDFVSAGCGLNNIAVGPNHIVQWVNNRRAARQREDHAGGASPQDAELFDAVAIGNQAPWKHYFAEDAIYFDEKGSSMDKPALVADITPLPKAYSGTIKMVKAQSRILGQTAILTYDLDETETIYGQSMIARYHGTDTWMFRDGRWQIVAGVSTGRPLA
jgi:hypothetical protein